MQPVPNDGKFCALSRGKISAQSNKYFFCYSQNKFLGGSIWPPLGFTTLFEYLYITFLFFEISKNEQHHRDQWIFLVFLMYQAQKVIFFPKNFHFFWLIWLKNLKKIFKNFFKLETCDRYQTTANFVLHHVVKFQLNRISTFLLFTKQIFIFRAKNHIFIFGVWLKIDLYPLWPPNLVKNCTK